MAVVVVRLRILLALGVEFVHHLRLMAQQVKVTMVVLVTMAQVVTKPVVAVVVLELLEETQLDLVVRLVMVVQV
jgi:hypothetical protein